MHIAYDPQAFSFQAHGGVSRYFLETALALGELPDTRVSVLAFAHLNDHLRAASRGLVVGRPIPVLPEPLRPFLVRANLWLARRWLRRHDVDLVHETYYSRRGSARAGVPTVLTVFDMIHEKFPDYAPRTARVAATKRAAIERASHVICISESTRRDLLELHRIGADRVSVVTLGFAALPGGGDASPRPVAAPYVLFVGKRGGYKDFGALLRAYARSPAVHRDHRLVCFGDVPFTRGELAAVKALGLSPERLLHVSGDDRRLGLYYRHAALFVYPSRYEGFGMPPLEAMSLECPVVCSNAASLPEVVGDAALTVEAGNAEALRHAMEKVLGSLALADDLRRRGRERVRRFSWERCARETRAVYASVLAKPRGTA